MILDSASPGTMVLLGGVTIFVLLGLSAFFSSAEIAMFSLPRHRLEMLTATDEPGADVTASLLEDPHRLLVTILVGNNLVNIAMSAIATALFGHFLTQGQAVLAATFGITALVLLFGESAPKSYAIENTESWALTIARPLKYAEYVLFPLIVTFDVLTRLVNRLTGGGRGIEDSYVTRDEIQELIETGENAGVIDTDELAMLQRIFRFDGMIAKEVMTPRLDVTAIDRRESIETAIDLCVESDHRRLPVYERDLDTVVGIVELTALAKAETAGGDATKPVQSIVTEPLLVPETKNVDELFGELREHRRTMAVVIDEFGACAGIVTIEDIVEGIVGEILDEQERQPIREIRERLLLVEGTVTIEDLNATLEADIPEDGEYETVAGFLFNQAGRLVEQGESFTYDDVTLTVDSVEGMRITSVRIDESGRPTQRDGEVAI